MMGKMTTYLYDDWKKYFIVFFMNTVMSILVFYSVQGLKFPNIICIEESLC